MAAKKKKPPSSESSRSEEKSDGRPDELEALRAELAWYREREAQLLLYASGEADELDVLTLDPEKSGLLYGDGAVHVVSLDHETRPLVRRGPWSSGDKERLADDDWSSPPVDELVWVACREPSLAEALSYAAISDCERAIRQAFRNARDGRSDPNGALWDTCFLSLFKQVIKVYEESQRASRDDEGAEVSEERRTLARIAAENVLLHENLSSAQDRCGQLLMAARAMRAKITELGGKDPGPP